LRDQVVQRQITEMLQFIFPESAKQPRGHRYVKDIIGVLAETADHVNQHPNLTTPAPKKMS
jgi:hypothetical protein